MFYFSSYKSSRQPEDYVQVGWDSSMSSLEDTAPYTTPEFAPMFVRVGIFLHDALHTFTLTPVKTSMKWEVPNCSCQKCLIKIYLGMQEPR